VEVAPRQARPGDRIELRGEGHAVGCDDTGESPPAEPLLDLPVTWQQGATSRGLGRVDATTPGGVVQTTITVPVDAQPGTAEVTVGAAEPALVTVGPADVSRAPVRPAPADGTYEEALATGVLRADLATGCLWLESPDGASTVQLLLQGDSYRVDLAAAPAAVLDGDTVVARIGDRIEVGGGISDRETGVEGCPVRPPVFVGYFSARPGTSPAPAVSPPS
jgi:hypothetical protein